MVTKKVSSCSCAVIPLSTDFIKWPIRHALNCRNSLRINWAIQWMDASFTTCWTSLDKRNVCKGLISAWMQPASVKAVVRNRRVFRVDGSSLPRVSTMFPNNRGGVSANIFSAIIVTVVDMSNVE